MKSQLLNLIFVFCATLVCAGNAAAIPSLNGQWRYILTVNGDTVSEGIWTLKQNGASLTGSGASGTHTWTSVGSVTGTEFAKVDTYNNSSYTLGELGIINDAGTQITGSWNDTLEAEGDFIADRITPIELTPETKIQDAPAISVVSKDITVTMEKFNKALPKGGRKMSALATRAAKPKLDVRYEVTVKGATRQQTRAKIVSKRNEITIKKLAPGNYTSTYRVQAFQGEKRIYQSNVSPAASFTIRKK